MINCRIGSFWQIEMLGECYFESLSLAFKMASGILNFYRSK
ncbi:hypothetical protein LEP1GSC127_4502 [Leptospira kirschneri str. 200801925]|uniref:Uncharacterized protein n=1 Tax=Leptospira kirschneri str. 200802841 TaxID=1193047 RepID=A0A828XXY3_9LEPT|nr:hypothetical protein LEP1GSC044_0240 [Leptospira kirschneri serovar Grippotyphosa str. RM52]EKO52101.1 hypothetical protein LEP1GSC131_4230 [Leptospira kirschneri str. 200802841]EKQ84907.1 hypothetical protein LEP1GSC064_2900 [Leptospira kirschneri serovar Grippotyphosa str. Moskva]EKR08455.1 hypothetical protein LEP1GSC122_1634 [Leptospira kirschneri serovar Valbuzzi str. 200702274]EMJ95211.1 hypothetical protein LEP1GSC198_0534 [Leptospira kirschneri str. JB]EMK04845.1 hypothetical protei